MSLLLPRVCFTLSTLAVLPTLAAEKTEPAPAPTETPVANAMDEAVRQKFLTQSISGLTNAGSFKTLANLMFALSGARIEASQDIENVQVQIPFAGGYAPTWREMFDALGRATKSSWSYSTDRKSWVFAAPAAALPYSLKLASNWTQEDQGAFLMCKPALAPVGMDIYYMGTYSFEKNADKSLRRIRDEIAVTFASRLSKDVDSGDMKKVTIDGTDALYFETPTPRPGVIYRQWVMVKNGLALAIVSAIDANNEKAILPDVEAMVKTLRVQRP